MDREHKTTQAPPKKSGKLRKLDISVEEDFDLITHLAGKRIPVSDIWGIKNDFHILLFHCLYTFREHIYYLEEKDIIVIFYYKRYNFYKTGLNPIQASTLEEEKGQEYIPTIFDIISKSEFILDDVLNRILPRDIGKVVIYFTPPTDPLPPIWEVHTLEPSELFVKPVTVPPVYELPCFMFPITSQA